MKNELFGSITEYTNSNTAGSKLKSLTGWKAYIGITNEDAFGFSALSAGYRGSYGSFYFEGNYAYFWSSTESDSSRASSVSMDYYYADAGLGNITKYFGYSVRCLKD